jgi:hypothetical protein
MERRTTSTAIPTSALKIEALSNISASFEVFCLASGVEALAEMMDHDAQAICGPRHAPGAGDDGPVPKRCNKGAHPESSMRPGDRSFHVIAVA